MSIARLIRMALLALSVAAAQRLPSAQEPPKPAATPQPAAPQTPSDSVVFVGAGDIANCEVNNGAGARATAALLDNIPGTVFTLGDHAYLRGTDEEFRRCYDPSWGRHKARTRPTT